MDMMSEYGNQICEWAANEGWLRICQHLIVLWVLVRLLGRLGLRSRGRTGLKDNLVKMFIRLGKHIPMIRKKMQNQLETQAIKNVGQLLKTKSIKCTFSALPPSGLTEEQILSLLDTRKNADIDPTVGKTFAYVYKTSEQHNRVTERCFLKYMHSNALNPVLFNSLRVTENEVIRMSSSLFHGDENCVGNITSCGTESLLLAMKTYRDYRGSGEVIMCRTGHPGINKGCKYVGLDVVEVDFDPCTKRMDIAKLKKVLSSRTAVVVCSAPQYPHGVVDDVQQIARICSRVGVPVHVDSAIGGYVLPFIQKLGRKRCGLWDFRVAGVMSINADVHKYGYSPKGSSVLIYRNSKIRRNQYFSFSTWPGGIYISPTAMGTRNGGCLASAWGSLLHLGEEGFLDSTRKIVQCVDRLVEAIQSNQHLELMAIPDSTIVAFRGKDISSYKLADCVKDLGFQLEMQSNPECLHMSVMPQHAPQCDAIIKAINEAVEIILKHPDRYEGDSKAVYGMLAKIPDEAVVEDFMVHYMDQIYKYS